MKLLPENISEPAGNYRWFQKFFEVIWSFIDVFSN